MRYSRTTSAVAKSDLNEHYASRYNHTAILDRGDRVSDQFAYPLVSESLWGGLLYVIILGCISLRSLIYWIFEHEHEGRAGIPGSFRTAPLQPPQPIAHRGARTPGMVLYFLPRGFTSERANCSSAEERHRNRVLGSPWDRDGPPVKVKLSMVGISVIEDG